MRPTSKAYIQLHIAVVLFGLTAILGDLIQLSAMEIVWWRVLITCLSLFAVVNLFQTLPKLPLRQVGIFLWIGLFVAIHWLCFYGAIKYSNASITLVCLATTSFFTSLVEPFITKVKFDIRDALYGLLIVPGMMMIANNVDVSYRLGIIVGLVSALFAAIFSSMNKKHIERADPYTITFLELGGSWIVISVAMALMTVGDYEWVFWPNGMDWVYMIILALLCTTLAYSLALKSLKYLSAFSSSLVINLEPVYGIILAAALLKEHQEMSVNVYIGVLFILLVVLSYPYVSRKWKSPES